MHTKTHIAVVLVIILSLLSCKKDKTPTASSDCYDFEFQEISIIYDYVLSGKQYMAPCFNPNNPNELVYYFRDYDNGTTQLKKYNLSTGQQTVIVDNPGGIYGQPKWGKNGWIAYTHSAGYVDHIYIVKDNGDSLRQFTNELYNYSPALAPNGKLYWQHSPVLGIPYYFLSQNLNNNTIDTISKNSDLNQGYSNFNDINNNNKLISNTIINNQMTIGILNLNSPSSSFNELINLENQFNIDHPTGLCWSGNEESAYMTIYADGLYKINTTTGQYTQLISFCDSKRYEIISCSSDGKYLVAERVDSKENHEEGKIYEKHKIYLIELATMKETAVDLE